MFTAPTILALQKMLWKNYTVEITYPAKTVCEEEVII